MTFLNFHKKTITIVSIALLLFTAMLSVWRLRPISEEEFHESDATIEREESYMLIADGDTLLLFSDIIGDTLLCGAVGKDDSVACVTKRTQAQWVNRLPVIPSCNGRLSLLPPDTASICKAGTDRIRSLISTQQAYITQLIATLTEHKEHTTYYLRTHNVTEMGFEVVAKETERLTSDIDSLLRVDSILNAVKKRSSLQIAYNARYFAYVPRDSDTVRVECEVADAINSMLVVKTVNGDKPVNLSTRLTVYNAHEATERFCKRHHAVRVLPERCKIDSLGVYHGEMDKTGKAHGYGRHTAHDGSYYEGEWEHGKRHGFGMSLPAGKRMCIGEWKDDCYLGERITYTDERIYGIDISRYQHEKGRKRFKINWNSLAITSLGHKSKKNISGTVNYPISFIYIKSTEGKSVVNRYFFADYRAARAHGYRVGAYHFFSTKTTGAKQAMHFLKKSRYQHGDMPPVLDVEPSAKQIREMGGVNAMFAHIRKWLNMVEQAWRVRPVLYISQTFVNKYLPAAPDLMKNYNVWIARYGEYKPDVNLVYWQLCPDGRVRGIQTEVDINVFNGFESEWKNYK